MTERDVQIDEARRALATVAQTKAGMAETIANCPPWRHALFAAIFAVLIASVAISSFVQFATIPFILAAIFLVKKSDERRLGVFVNGYRPGKTRKVSLSFVAVIVVLVVAAMNMRTSHFSNLSKAGLTAISFAIAYAYSVVWQRVFLNELREQDAE
ncbi:hypothetical protein RXV95_10230 [Novosphingobium sp. ZN18A2]|uniref:hypothetical protein n=1 Tax=Novosphingobium sp. ZN18A2 TaxID=3079861 RepID=UPI0030CC8CA6